MSKKEIVVVADKKQKRSFFFSRWVGQISLWYKKNRAKKPIGERPSNIDISNLSSSIESLIYDDQSSPKLDLSEEKPVNKDCASDSDAKAKQKKLLKEFALLSGIELSSQFVADFRDSVEKQLETKYYLPPPLAREPELSSSADNIEPEFDEQQKEKKNSATIIDVDEKIVEFGSKNSLDSENITENEAEPLGAAGEFESLSQNLTSKPAYDEEAMKLVLSELKSINLINSVVVVGADGVILACSDLKCLNKSTFEGVMLGSVKHFQSLGEKSGFGLLTRSVIEFEEGKLIVESLGESVLFIIVDHSAILGLIRKKSKIQIEKLKLILN